MKPPAIAARDMIHICAQGALGTLLADAPGQPFVSAIEFAPDADNAPIFLVSRLAEHTRNLERDPRASLLLTAAPGEGGLLAQARMTIVGEARRFDAGVELIARFLRYQPDAERYLALGDFGFFHLHATRARVIGGFGSMGWLGGEALAPPSPLSPEFEANLLASVEQQGVSSLRVLGVDREGVDLLRDGQRERRRFPALLTDTHARDGLRAALAEA